MRRFQRNKTIIEESGVSDGPRFVIDEVLAAYRIPQAISTPHREDEESDGLASDAYVVADGRVWTDSGSDETADTYQVLGPQVQHLIDLDPSGLERIGAGLQTVPEPLNVYSGTSQRLSNVSVVASRSKSPSQ